ncbi:MAG: HAMP domain-containing histidine kinase [Rickettsiales bacterium]|nr:HAMP domain-containing histidine kinase [Rickettsiales bacterium]
MYTIHLPKNQQNFLSDFISEKIFKAWNFSFKKKIAPKFSVEAQSVFQGNLENKEHFSNTEFLTAIVHELKTPLSAIQSFADVLLEEISNPSSQKDCLSCVAEIKQAAAEMNELIHDILDVAQVASGNFSVDLSQKIDLRDAVKRAVRLNYDYALRRNVSLKFEVSDDVKAVKLDAKRMKQVLTNLISNAVKYSPAHKEVKIICKNNYEFFEISVIDQGFGMSAAQIEAAFEKYQTIQNPNSGSVDSFGLGLPITKQLVELQNGVIEVISEVGKGTEFKIKFPLQLM